MSDGCTGTLNCGSCTSPQTCGGGGTANVCGCTPTTCAAQGKNCGSISDGCGGTLNCGTCTNPNTCGGGGTANVCGCTGTQCCTSSTNTDGDCMTDCIEQQDGDSWTDPNVFNGMQVRRTNQCSTVGSCNENDTLNEVNQCVTQQGVDETKNQCAGWDWSNPPDDICNSGYGFTPNWSGCDSSWAADWRGFINLTAGNHCFRITGSTGEGCASLFFNTQTTGIQTGAAAQCFNVAAGVYPIRWHYTMDNGSSSSMHVMYCAGGGSTCTPNVVLPARMLRPTYP